MLLLSNFKNDWMVLSSDININVPKNNLGGHSNKRSKWKQNNFLIYSTNKQQQEK